MCIRDSVDSGQQKGFHHQEYAPNVQCLLQIFSDICFRMHNSMVCCPLCLTSINIISCLYCFLGPNSFSPKSLNAFYIHKPILFRLYCYRFCQCYSCFGNHIIKLWIYMNNLLLEYKAALTNKYNIDKMISHIVEKDGFNFIILLCSL